MTLKSPRPRPTAVAASPAIAAEILRLDAFRRSPDSEQSERGTFKEWLHFCVGLPGGHVIVNFSLMERRSPTGLIWTDAHLTAIANTPAWCGFVQSYEPGQIQLRARDLYARFGASSMRFRDGAFELDIRSPALSLVARLVPLTAPTVSLGVDRSLHWVIVPRLQATGWASVKGQRIELAGTPAYHDHNWGDFTWGADVGWEWGFFLPDDDACPFALVFSRILTDGGRQTKKQGTILWQGENYVRTFNDHEMEVAISGSHRQPAPLTLPPACALLVPGRASGVPERLTLTARGLGGELRAEFATESCSRIAIPSDVDPFGTVLLNEATGRAKVTGNFRGQAIDYQGSAIVEFVRGK